MKIKKRILSVTICLVLLVLAALTVFATDGPVFYSGNIDNAYLQLGKVDAKPKLNDKIKTLDNLVNYVETIDPASEGFAALNEAIDQKEIEVADLILLDNQTYTLGSDRRFKLDELAAYMERHPFEDKRADDENFTNKFNKEVTLIAEIFLNESYASVTADGKHTALDEIISLEETYTVSASDIYNKEAIENENFAAAQLFLGEVNINDGTAKLGAAVRRVNGFIKDHVFPVTVPGYSSFMAEVSTVNNAFVVAYERAKAEVSRGAALSDWDKAPVIHNSFTDASGVKEYNVGQLKADKNMSGTTMLTYIGEQIGKDGDNGYYTVTYDQPAVNFRTDANINNTIAGRVVFECDFTTFGVLPVYDTTKVIWFENGTGSATGAAKSWSQVYMSINANGDIVSGKNSGEILVKNAVTKGQWVHISLALDTIYNDVYVYVDYELVASYKLTDSEGFACNFARIRMGANPTYAGGEFSLDNVLLYQGLAPRDLNFFDGATDADKFVFYAEQLTNEGLPLTARKEYYDGALKLLDKFYDGNSYLVTDSKIRNAVDTVNNYDSASVVEAIKAENLVVLQEIEAKLRSFGRSEASYDKRTYFVGRVDTYLNTCGGLVTAGPAYNATSAYFSTVREELAEEDLLKEFANYVINFYSASSIGAMESNYALAKDMIEYIDVDLANDSGFPSFAENYKRYLEMETKLNDNRIIDNSKRLLACIQFIYDYDTPEEWEENYDYLVSYVTMAGDIINSRAYDAYYKNTSELIEHFMPMYQYFDVRVQEKHIEHIENDLARFDSLPFTRYFEKYGIVLKLRDYIGESRIDYENETLAALVATVEGHIADLEAQRGDYDELLKENTKVFVEKCMGLVGSISYKDMKRLCDEAKIYYYSMDINDASAQDAISIYTARLAEIEAVEAEARAFVDAVLKLATPEIDIAAVIVEASKYYKNLDTDVEGVALAIEQYERAFSEYNESVAVANGELECALKVICASTIGDNNGSLITKIINAILG